MSDELKRAYSVLTVKEMDESKREITGIATTPSPDRVGDIVEPKGAVFKLPLPLLWQHSTWSPIGHVTSARVTDEGIEVRAKLSKIDEPGVLKDRLDEAWQSIKSGLVRGLSIGFRSLEAARIDQTFSQRFLKWEWLELSAVTVPANADATILAIKSAHEAARRHGERRIVRLDGNTAPGALGQDLGRKHVVYLMKGK